MLFAENHILMNLTATTQEELIRQMVQQAANLGKVTHVNEVVESVLKREAMSSTGFGKGIAIPHGQTDAVLEPTLWVGKTNNQIEWNALDAKPVQIAFLILVPATAQSEHLNILAQLARRLMHDEFVESIHGATSTKELMNILAQELV
ncbi:PTS sugar transporter subunit IIA [Alicyclobacillaceae bacterium I2511]|nr:PTS sugar transporter subunit IIA [Alicyclobacillaceae bacterium I2511]